MLFLVFLQKCLAIQQHISKFICSLAQSSGRLELDFFHSYQNPTMPSVGLLFLKTDYIVTNNNFIDLMNYASQNVARPYFLF